MIKNIIFDLSEVYLQGVTGVSRHLKKTLGNDITDSELLTSDLHKLFLGQISEEEYWQRVVRLNAWDFPTEIFKDAVRQNFKEIVGTREIIEGVKQNGYRLGLLSNHVKEWVKYCEKKFNYRELFAQVVYSFDAQSAKPDPEAFLFIIKKLKIDPAETLFIDDYSKNVVAAQKLGLKAIQFISPGDLKKELERFKINLT